MAEIYTIPSFSNSFCLPAVKRLKTPTSIIVKGIKNKTKLWETRTTLYVASKIEMKLTNVTKKYRQQKSQLEKVYVHMPSNR